MDRALPESSLKGITLAAVASLPMPALYFYLTSENPFYGAILGGLAVSMPVVALVASEYMMRKDVKYNLENKLEERA